MLRLTMHWNPPQRAKRGQRAPSTPVGLQVGAGAGAQDLQDLGLAAARAVGQVPAVALVRQQRECAGPDHCRSPCQGHGLASKDQLFVKLYLEHLRAGDLFLYVSVHHLGLGPNPLGVRWRGWICMHGRRHLMKVARRCTGSADAREACRVTVCEDLNLDAPGQRSRVL